MYVPLVLPSSLPLFQVRVPRLDKADSRTPFLLLLHTGQLDFEEVREPITDPNLAEKKEQVQITDLFDLFSYYAHAQEEVYVS